jgi:hypothetical protein
MNGIGSSKALESGDFFTSSTSQKKLKSLERHRRHRINNDDNNMFAVTTF